MNLREPWSTVARTLAPYGERVLPATRGRWRILFGRRQRPLLMPEGAYPLQKRCLKYFVDGGLNSLYAKTLLKVNSIVPGAGLLPELYLPSVERNLLPRHIPFGDAPYSAIQIGTSGPYQKASILFVTERGEVLALAKVAMVPSADRMVATEAHWLKALESFKNLTGQVPGLLAEGTAVSGRRYLVTTVAPSTVATRTFSEAHTRFLGKLGRSSLQIMRFRASHCFQYLLRTHAQIEPYIDRDAAARLQRAVRDCAASLADWTGPWVIAQGDFAPWNIRVHKRRIFVFDWEYAGSGSSPLADVFHYFMIQRAVSSRSISDQYLAHAMERATEVVQQTYREWTWRPRVVSGLALAYLLQVLLHYTRASRRLDMAHPVVKNYWRLVEARTRWMVS